MSNANMTSKVAGGPMPVSGDIIHEEAKAGLTSRATYVAEPLNDRMLNNFPIVPVAPDKYDDLWNIKNTVAKDPAAGRWTVPLEGNDAAYLARRRDRLEKAAYDEWVYAKFDLTDPATLRMVQQLAPELWERREEVINYQLGLVDRYAKMRLFGPRSEEDLKLEWLVETGRIVLPAGSIWDPPKHTQAAQNRAYAAGYFSPLKNVEGGYYGGINEASDLHSRTGRRMFKNAGDAILGNALAEGPNPPARPDYPSYV
jgi:hypothetical protein